MNFLGYRVSATGLDPVPQKVAAIEDFLRPTTVQKLREFFEMINYYHQLIPQAAALLAPLNDLIKGAKNSSKSLDWEQDA